MSRISRSSDENRNSKTFLRGGKSKSDSIINKKSKIVPAIPKFNAIQQDESYSPRHSQYPGIQSSEGKFNEKHRLIPSIVNAPVSRISRPITKSDGDVEISNKAVTKISIQLTKSNSDVEKISRMTSRILRSNHSTKLNIDIDRKGKIVETPISTTTHDTINIINDDKTEALRRVYLTIFEQQKIQSNPVWWRCQFMDAVINAINNFESKHFLSKHECVLSYADQHRLIDRPLFVGKMLSCDIKFEKYYVSRLHAIITPFLNKIAIIDVGSSFGIETIWRSSKDKITGSYPNNRTVLLFHLNETVMLQLGSEQIIITWKECIVCLSQSRSYVFNCGHSFVCNYCFTKLSICPQCQLQESI